MSLVNTLEWSFSTVALLTLWVGKFFAGDRGEVLLSDEACLAASLISNHEMSVALPPVVTIKKCLQTLLHVPWGMKMPEKHSSTSSLWHRREVS